MSPIIPHTRRIFPFRVVYTCTIDCEPTLTGTSEVIDDHYPPLLREFQGILRQQFADRMDEIDGIYESARKFTDATEDYLEAERQELIGEARVIYEGKVKSLLTWYSDYATPV